MYRKPLDVLRKVYENASSVITGKGKRTTINELTDQVPATRPAVLLAAVNALLDVAPVPEEATVVVSEEDKGAVMAGLFAVRIGLPLAMARRYAYEIPGSIVVDVSMEYENSRLTLNGVKRGDKVIIVDDTLATGGTLIALIEAINRAGGKVVDIRTVVEKIGYGGRERVFFETGHTVHSALGISVDDSGKVSVSS